MPSLRFISGAGAGAGPAQGVIGQINALNTSIANLNVLVDQLSYVTPITKPQIKFYLNGSLVTINNPDPTLSLVDYLRYQTRFFGTKKQCNQGGCGVCAVMLSYWDADSALVRNVSINSCLRLLINCDGCVITTSEGILYKPYGFHVSSTTLDKYYHPVQERIAKTYGLQCGGCTSGIVMATYAALQPNTFNPIADNMVEKLIDGNICRCSCYNGITKMIRSFLPSSRILGLDGSLIGYNLGNKDETVAVQTALNNFKTGAVSVIDTLVSSEATILQTSSVDQTGAAGIIATNTAKATAFKSTYINLSMSDTDIYNSFNVANTTFLTNITNTLNTLGLYQSNTGATGAFNALYQASALTGAFAPVASLFSTVNSSVYSALADANTGAFQAIATGSANLYTAVTDTVNNFISNGFIASSSTGADLLSSLLINAGTGVLNAETYWATYPTPAGLSLYKAQQTGSLALDSTLNTVLSSYDTTKDVNGSQYASFLQTYSKPTTAFFASEPYNFTYHRVSTIDEAVGVFNENGYETTELIVSGTSYGIPGYGKKSSVTAYIDVNNIAELNASSVTASSATFGANVPLNKIAYLLSLSSDSKFQKIAKHIDFIAGQHVRNAGSWAGNIMMAKKGGFASDAAMVLLGAGASFNITLISATGTTSQTVDANTFYNTSYSNKALILRNVVIPASVSGEFFDSYRVAPRNVNAYAYLVNALDLVINGSGVITSARVVYGATTNSPPQLAVNTSSYLVGKTISTGTINTVVSGALALLPNDITIVDDPSQISPQYPQGTTPYRRSLVLSMFFMSMLKLARQLNIISAFPGLETGIEDWVNLTRDTNTTYDYMYNQIPDFKLYPLHYPMLKWDAKGIAGSFNGYTDDMPCPADALFMGVAHTTKGSVIQQLSQLGVPGKTGASINWDHPNTINALAAARNTPGVKHVITAKDLPGIGVSNDGGGLITNHDFLADTNFLQVGFPFAIVLATTQDVAWKVARELKVEYNNSTPQPRTISEAVSGGLTTVSIVGPVNSQLYDQLGYLETPLMPYSKGDGALEVRTGYINKSSTGGNLIAPAGTYTGGPRSGLQYWNATGVQGTYRGFKLEYAYTGYQGPSASAFTGTSVTEYTSSFVYSAETGGVGGYYTGTWNFTGTYTYKYMTNTTGTYFSKTGSVNIPINYTYNSSNLWSPLIVSGQGYANDNHHFPMEKLTSYCYRDDDGTYILYSKLQYGAYQLHGQPTLPALGLNNSQVKLICKRQGGGFGHTTPGYHVSFMLKAPIISVMVSGCPVKAPMELETDMKIVGARPDILWNYSIGCRPDGKIDAVNVNFTQGDAHGLCSPIGGLLMGEIASNINSDVSPAPNFHMTADIALVPRPMRCAQRSFGNIEGNYGYACMLDDVAAITGLTVNEITAQNLIVAGSTGPNVPAEVYQKLYNKLTTEPKYDYTNRMAAVTAFNAANKYKKRGLAIQQHQYAVQQGFSFDNRDAFARIWPDGTVYFWPCIVDSGQGGEQKALQALSYSLRCPMSAIKMQVYDNWIHRGNPSNGGSAGSEAAMYLAANLAEKLNVKLNTRVGKDAAGNDIVVDGSGNPILDATGKTYNLTAGVQNNDPTAWNKLISLFNAAASWTAPQGQAGWTANPAVYAANAAYPPLNPSDLGISPSQNTMFFIAAVGTNDLVAMADMQGYKFEVQNIYFISMNEVEVDILTGNVKILRTDVVYDIGESANRSLDIGQLEGGMIYGMGYYFKEQRLYGNSNEPLTVNSWEYKPPSSLDIPEEIHVEFLQNPELYAQRANKNARPFPFGSKATQEMGVLLAGSAYLAVKQAIRSFRLENSLGAQFQLDAPALPSRIKQACGTLSLSFN